MTNTGNLILHLVQENLLVINNLDYQFIILKKFFSEQRLNMDLLLNQRSLYLQLVDVKNVNTEYIMKINENNKDRCFVLPIVNLELLAKQICKIIKPLN